MAQRAIFVLRFHSGKDPIFSNLSHTHFQHHMDLVSFSTRNFGGKAIFLLEPFLVFLGSRVQICLCKLLPFCQTNLISIMITFS